MSKVDNKRKNIANCAGFLAIAFVIFYFASMLFRSNSIEGRQSVKGFKSVQGDVDVVMVGASNFLRFYMPMKAYADYGYTSYNYVTKSASLDMIKYYLEDIRKTQDPELYVIGYGIISYLTDEIKEYELRNWSDAMDPFSPVRIKAVTEYLQERDLNGVDILSYYCEFIKYHDNTDALKDISQYELLLPKYHNVNKGYGVNNVHTPLERPQKVTASGKLSKKQEDSLRELLEYCREENLNVLFVNCVNANGEAIQRTYNAASELISEYGFEVLDTNDHYDDMGLDFEVDMRDAAHVNYLGALKFTDYLSGYINDNYEFPDHRGDEKYYKWDADSLIFEDEQKVWESEIYQVINEHLEAKKTGEALPMITDINEYLDKIRNENFTVLIAKQGGIDPAGLPGETVERLAGFGLLTTDTASIGIWDGTKWQYQNTDTDETCCEAEIGNDMGRGTKRCTIYSDGTNAVSVDFDEVINTEEPAVIVVFDNNYEKVVDAAALSGVGGSVAIIR